MSLKKYTNKWKEKVKTKKAFRSFTSHAMPFRSITGNFNTNVKNKEKYKNELSTIMKYLKSKPINTPTLYKGIRNKNANVFLKTGVFKTRAPTSSSLYWYPAMKFTNFNNPVLLIIPPGKYHAAVMGKRGINSANPDEFEVVLPPGEFKLIKRNNNMKGYIVNYKEK